MLSPRGKVARFTILLIGCLGLSMCLLACGKSDNNTGEQRKQAEAAIRQQDDAWLKALGGRQLDATVSYYADGAVLLAPNAPIARTKDEIRQTWSQVFASVPAGVPFTGGTTHVEVANSGDLGYATGFYTIDNPPIDKGKYLEVWKKQPDGSWKAIADIFNSDMPTPSPVR
jgi:ketosteroid isomerase-like protein